MNDQEGKIKELNEIREAIFSLYPNSKKITITIDGDKIRVAPIEDYAVPVGSSSEE